MLSLVIATRKSRLAQIQTEIVIRLIKDRFNIECEKLLIETEGDIRLEEALNKIGGKGLFVKDIEVAMSEGMAHAAVHSMKDVPFALADIFEIAAVPAREDARDVYVAMNGVSFFDLPKGAQVGTSSIRRSVQAKLLKPDIEIVPIRGNVQTRIDKIEREDLDGIILAAAGLKRMNMENLITDCFDEAQFIPAVGQGALGVEIVTNSENAAIFRQLDNEDIRKCVEAERSFMRALNGGCHTSIAAHAQIQDDKMYIIGGFEVAGSFIKKDIEGDKDEYMKLGQRLAEKVIRT